MSATADGGPFPRDAESRYFDAVAEAFVKLRGAPLLVSPADYQIAKRWHADGVPLSLVVATMDEVFAKRRARGAKDRINGIRYCARAVDAAWAEVRELRGPARREAASEPPVGERLAELAAALPERLAEREEWRQRLLALGGPAAAVEAALRTLEEELLATAEAALEPAERARLDAEVGAILEGLRDRFPDGELGTLRGRLYRQRLRRLLELPVLTLF